MTTRALVVAIGLGIFLVTGSLGPAFAAVDPALSCVQKKAKAAGKKAFDLSKAFGKNIKKSNPAKLDADVSKAQSKFTKSFTKEESKLGCLTTGDSDEIETKADDFVASVIEDFGATCGNSVAGGGEECDQGPSGGPDETCPSGVCLSDCTCADCGDGVLLPPEECDDGAANGTAASCCNTDCTFKGNGEACTDDLFCNGTETCDGAGTCGSSTGDPCPGTECNTCQEGGDTCTVGTCCTDPASTVCTDGDGNDCTVAGCDGAGTCDQNHIFTPASDPCADIDGDMCTVSGCDGAGTCDQNHSAVPCAGPTECDGGETCNPGTGLCDPNADAPASTPCTDTTNECADAGCDGAGNCDQNHMPTGASTPCTDTDGNACTTAGCDGAGACDQGHVVEPDDSQPTGCDGGSTCAPESCQSGSCVTQSACCSGSFTGLLGFETALAVGDCGRRGNFRCSNNADTTCVTNAECDLGTCFDPPGICSGDFDVSCSGNGTPCTGTCGQVGGYAPLVCGGLYTGGGGNSVPLPLPIPDMGNSFTTVTSCNALTGELTLASTTSAQTGSDRTCTQGRTCSGGSTNPGTSCVLDGDCPGGTCDDNCLFGPPLPIPNANSTPTSVCVVNVPDEATSGGVSGTAQCDGGDTSLSLPLRSVIHLAGDILSTAVGPIAGGVPGIQACPLCSAQCSGGANDTQPCEDNSECPGGACDGTPNCIGGPSHGNTCTPGTSGPAALNVGFPTSHDCPPQSSQSITDAIGGLPVAFALSSGTQVLNAVDQPALRRTFCGFCRDVNIEGSNCFDGDPDPGMVGGCPDSSAQANCDPDSGTTTGCGAAIACDDDSDCTAPYESCAQRSSGAFSAGATTRIEAFGSTDGMCLGDGGTHSANLVSIFCIPPTFDATVDSAGDLPGPGAAMLQGDAELQ